MVRSLADRTFQLRPKLLASDAPAGAAPDFQASSDEWEVRVMKEVAPGLKGSIGEGPNHSNFSDRSSVRILGIERKPRKTTSSKWHATQNTRRGHRKGKQTALRQRGGLRSRTNSNDAILAIKRCNACLHKRICLPSKYGRSAVRAVKIRIECQG